MENFGNYDIYKWMEHPHQKLAEHMPEVFQEIPQIPETVSPCGEVLAKFQTQ